MSECMRCYAGDLLQATAMKQRNHSDEFKSREHFSASALGMSPSSALLRRAHDAPAPTPRRPGDARIVVLREALATIRAGAEFVLLARVWCDRRRSVRPGVERWLTLLH
jgi:hypothetical protein